jgi:potassium efflux system protein
MTGVAVILFVFSISPMAAAGEADPDAQGETPKTVDRKQKGDTDGIDTDGDPEVAVAGYAAKAAAAQAHIDAVSGEIADEALRKRVAEQWKEAVAQWQKAGQAAEQFGRRRQLVEGASTRIQAIQAESEALRNRAAAVEPGAERSLADLEADLRELDHNLPQWTKQLAQRVARMELHAERLTEARKDAEEAQARLDEKDPTVAESAPAELKAAIREAHNARRRADQEVIADNDYFKSIQDTVLQLDSAERDLLTRQIDFGKVRREWLSEQIAAKRHDEAEVLRRESETAVTNVLDALPVSFQEIAKENREYSEILDQYRRYEQKCSLYLQNRNEYIRNIQADFNRIREQLESGSDGQELGSYLWAKRRGLQREAYEAAMNGGVSSEADLPCLTLGRLDEMRRRIPRLEQELATVLKQSYFTAFPEKKRGELLDQARKILDYNVKLVDSLSESVSHRSAVLIDIEATNKELTRISAKYADLADRHIMRLPGTPPLWNVPLVDTVAESWNSLAHLYVWRNAAKTLFTGLNRSPWQLLFLLLAVVPALVVHILTKRTKFFNLSAHTPVAATPKGLLWRATQALLRSYSIPLALFAVGNALWRPASPSSIAASIGESLLATALPLLLLNLWRHFCDADNLFEIYVRMPRNLAERLRRRLTTVMRVGLPLWFATWFAQSRTEPVAFQTVGGIMSALLAAVALAFWLLRMRPAVFLSDSARPWPVYYRALHFLMIALATYWLAISLLGFNYGAMLITSKVTVSGIIFTVLAIAAQYWNLRLMRARERQRARAIMYYRFGGKQRETRPRESKTGKSGRIPTNKDLCIGKEKEDLNLINDAELDALSSPAIFAAASIPPALEKELNEALDNAKRLIRWLFIAALVIVFLIQWADIFPVQEWFGKMTLLVRENADGLTLRDVFRAFAGGALCCLIAVPLGDWINLSFFSWNPTEHGTRMATSALVRYAIIGAGAIWTAQELGMAWSDAQWLVAALGVGLGFGLQEIILNFVSGIILLFERPVRVGDMVTIGSAEGTIKRINIRTTTVVDANMREMIIPNKELVTGRVINWTLSNTVTRLVVPVGVAYGSDLDLVQRILLEAANTIGAVLDDPAPSVFFSEMAESGLNFELRVFTEHLSDRGPVQHQIRLNINDMFRKNNIEIPFPQLDVHMRPQNA